MMEITGERFIPEAMGGQLIEAEHHARYRFASTLVPGKDVLDAGCGVGWGSALLHEAGARNVLGVDISGDAIADARLRAPGVSFEVGDICALDHPDGSFDVIVCFEAIEHVEDVSSALDNLARMLRPDGVIVVSSPNPDVYPAGNEFHVREFRPDELRDEMAQRFVAVSLWRQYPLIASVLLPDTLAHDEGTSAQLAVVGAVEPGRDPYSLVVASHGAVPRVCRTAVVCPDDQLQHLQALSESVERTREEMAADQAAIGEERRVVLEERAELHRQLVEAGSALAAKEREIEQLTAALAAAPDAQELEALKTLLEETRRDASSPTLRVAGAGPSPVRGEDRDRLGLMLLRSEQRVAELDDEAAALRHHLERALDFGARSPVST